MLDAYLKGDQPGCSVAVGVDGKVVWTGVRGVADRATGAKLTPDTVFDIASVSKQFTATAVLLLAGEGKLTVDDFLSEHVSELPAWARRVTIAQLMHHTSGIPDYFELLNARGVRFEDRATHAQALEAIAQTPRLIFEPGHGWKYSNSNYLLLGEIVRRVSGTPLPRFLHERIFVPLHLHMVLRPVGTVPGKATSYAGPGTDLRAVTHPWEHIGAAGIQTTPSELVRWADNYRTGKLGGRRLLDAQLANPAPNKTQDTDKLGVGTRSAYGAGIAINSDGTLGHVGAWAGFVTALEVSADRHTALAMACNAANINVSTLVDGLRTVWM